MKEERGFAPLQKCNGCKTQQQISVSVNYLDKRDLDVLDQDFLCDACWTKAHNAIWPKEIPIRFVDGRALCKCGLEISNYWKARTDNGSKVDDNVFCKCGREMIHLGDQDWFCAPCGWIEVKGSKA